MQILLRLLPKIAVVASLQKLRKWNNKLTQSSTNPFPLAPSDLLALGLVTSTNYTEQNTLLSNSRYILMLREIRRWIKGFKESNLEGLTFEIHGTGLARGFTFIEELKRLKMEVVIRDVSSVACKNIRVFLRSMGIKGCEVLRGDFLSKRSWCCIV